MSLLVGSGWGGLIRVASGCFYHPATRERSSRQVAQVSGAQLMPRSRWAAIREAYALVATAGSHTKIQHRRFLDFAQQVFCGLGEGRRASRTPAFGVVLVARESWAWLLL